VYLGSIFKEKKKVLLMTGVYSAGIFTIMIPIVLGAKVLASFFFRWHTETYIVGGSVMIAAAVMSLLGLKLPMPHLPSKSAGQADWLSTYVLGLTAGITAACCAPVLIGVLALSSLTPTLVHSLAVGMAFVGGMVAPLYLAAMVITRASLLERKIFYRRLFSITIGDQHYPVFVSNALSAIMFFSLGVITLILAITGRLSMPEGPATIVNGTAWYVNGLSDRWPIVNVLFYLVLSYFIFRVVRRLIYDKKNKLGESSLS
jgi:cytochrome c biogenesis protein CcdA